MQAEWWLKALVGGTWKRIYARHLRWQRPKKPVNENERREA